MLVELTASGRSAADAIREAIASLERRALAGLPADAIAGLRAGLRAMAEVSQRRDGRRRHPAMARAPSTS